MEDENRHSVLRLEFDDIWEEIYQLGQEIVTIDMVNSALDFGLNFAEQYNDEGTLLIHCHEGISRSTVIAIAILTAITNDISEAIDLVNEVRPQAKPNIEVIRIADDILQWQGELVKEVWEFFYP